MIKLNCYNKFSNLFLTYKKKDLILQSMPEEYRLVVMMRYYQKMSIDEIAQSLDLSRWQVLKILKIIDSYIFSNMADFERLFCKNADVYYHPLFLFILALTNANQAQ